MLNLALVLQHIPLTLTLTTCESSSFSINNGMKYIETQTPWSTWTCFNYFVFLTAVSVTGFLEKMDVLPVAAKIWDEGEGKALTRCRDGYFICCFRAFPLKNKGTKKIWESEIKLGSAITERKLVFAWGFSWFLLFGCFLFSFFLNNIFMSSGRRYISQPVKSVVNFAAFLKGLPFLRKDGKTGWHLAWPEGAF